MILGDFNARTSLFGDSQNSPKGNILAAHVLEARMIPGLIEGGSYTFFRGAARSKIDIIFYSRDFNHNIKSNIDHQDNFSDHKTIIHEIDFSFNFKYTKNMRHATDWAWKTKEFESETF